MRINVSLLAVILFFTVNCATGLMVAAKDYSDVPYFILAENTSNEVQPSENKSVTESVGRNILANVDFSSRDTEDKKTIVNVIKSIDEYDYAYGISGDWAAMPETIEVKEAITYSRDKAKGGVLLKTSSNGNSSFFSRSLVRGDALYYYSMWMKLDSGKPTDFQLMFSLYENKQGYENNDVAARYIINLSKGEYSLKNEWKQYQFAIYVPKQFDRFCFEPCVTATGGKYSLEISETEMYSVSEAGAAEIQKPDSATADTSASDSEKRPAVLRPLKNRPNSNFVKISAFEDINDVAWAAPAIESFYRKGIIDGTSDYRFDPFAVVTREQFAKLIVSVFDIETSAASSFKDVPSSSWSYPFVSAAYSNGIIKGVGDNEFGASMKITRQDMALMIVRAFDALGVSVEGGSAQKELSGVADYTLDAVDKLLSNGILFKINGSLYPGEYTCRADAAAVLYNARLYADRAGGLMVSYDKTEQPSISGVR